MRFFSLVVALPVAIQGQQGFVQDVTTEKFLTCDSASCHWDATPTQIFRKDPGQFIGEYSWHILKANGEDFHQCLDRTSCWWYESALRMGSCNHCGAKHWDYDPKTERLAEDFFKNCVQTTGRLARCSQSHAPIRWPVAAECNVKSQTLSNVQCKNRRPDGTCSAVFSYKPGAGHAAHSVGDCNACNSAPGSTKQCNFTMSMTVTHSRTIQFKHESSIEVQAGIKFKPDLTFADSGASFQVRVDESLEVGRSTASTKSYETQSNCVAKTKAGNCQNANAVFFGGIYFGDITADLTTSWDCHWKPDQKESITGTITISDVPQKMMVQGSCKLADKPCDPPEPLDVQV